MDDQNQQAPLDTAVSSSEPMNDDTSVLLHLEELIKSNIDAIDSLKEELRKHKEMFDDGLTNNAVFKEHNEKMKEMNKTKLTIRQEITKVPGVALLADKIRDLSTELREKKVALSEYLLEYHRLTGANEIEGRDGSLREIVKEAKLVKKNTKK